ncbi:MAG: MerR family transcriptional regulator [Brevirhabdus sp.]
MSKSPDAFRTISEVAEWLDTPAHVLRFWESRFTQIKPMKRAGGRRYYRPNDMRLIGGIKKLLHEDGMTIRGVQKILREQGIKHVSSLSQPIPGGEEHSVDAPPAAAPEPVVAVAPSEPDEEREVVTSLFRPRDKEPADASAVDMANAPRSCDGEEGKGDADAAMAEPDAPAVTETTLSDATAEDVTAPESVVAADAPNATPHDDPVAPAAPVAATPPSFLRPRSLDETGNAVPIPTRLRDLADIGAVPEGEAKASLSDLYRRLQALRDRVAREL